MVRLTTSTLFGIIFVAFVCNIKDLIAAPVDKEGLSAAPGDCPKKNAVENLQKEFDHMLQKTPEGDKPIFKKNFDGFMKLFNQYLQEEDRSIEWSKIKNLPDEEILKYGTLKQPEEDKIRDMLNKLVVVKLNGGLGTSMGCKGPKSIIPVKDHLNFLDLTVQQIQFLNNKYQAKVPLVLMDSFNTFEETLKIMKKYEGKIEIHHFEQFTLPRVHQETLLPIPKDTNVQANLDAWYPGGHGDFYEGFRSSGLLKMFLDQHREYCFVSNIDNLGATVDVSILNHLLGSSEPNSQLEFLMEITDKTRADVKGGTLIHYEGQVRLLEIAQVPKDRIEEFKSIQKFKYFNTNNLWIKLDAIERVLRENSLNMEIIENKKVTSNKVPVIQLETAAGAAIKSFVRGSGMVVPRSRFLPVKKTSDLMLVMSNLYEQSSDGTLVLSSRRVYPSVPPVRLGDRHFSKVEPFLKHFPSIPNMLDLDHLTVMGDVTFGKDITLKGTVIIIAKNGETITIPDGAIIENKVVTGSLRFMDY